MTLLFPPPTAAGPVMAQPSTLIKARYWYEVDDTYLTEGQGATVTFWMEYEPAPGAAMKYKGYDATMLWYQTGALSFFVKSATPGTYFYGAVAKQPLGINPEYDETSTWNGEVIAPGLLTKISVHNYSNWNPTPDLKTKNWLYKFMWFPSNYTHSTATFSNAGYLIKNSVFNLKVPALGKLGPIGQLVPSVGKIEPCPVITIAPKPCWADMNQDGALDVEDVVYFQTHFASGFPKYYEADCTGDWIVNLNDWTCFQQQFALGC